MDSVRHEESPKGEGVRFGNPEISNGKDLAEMEVRNLLHHSESRCGSPLPSSVALRFRGHDKPVLMGVAPSSLQVLYLEDHPSYSS